MPAPLPYLVMIEIALSGPPPSPGSGVGIPTDAVEFDERPARRLRCSAGGWSRAERRRYRYDPAARRHEQQRLMQLVVIAKEPLPGDVKTRLCPPCTLGQAAAIAEAALADTLAVVGRHAGQSPDRGPRRTTGRLAAAGLRRAGPAQRLAGQPAVRRLRGLLPACRPTRWCSSAWTPRRCVRSCCSPPSSPSSGRGRRGHRPGARGRLLAARPAPPAPGRLLRGAHERRRHRRGPARAARASAATPSAWSSRCSDFDHRRGRPRDRRPRCPARASRGRWPRGSPRSSRPDPAVGEGTALRSAGVDPRPARRLHRLRCPPHRRAAGPVAGAGLPPGRACPWPRCSTTSASSTRPPRVVAARTTSVLGLWLLAAATTVVLNLDTTVVLLTPLYLRLARRVGGRPAAARRHPAAAGQPGVVGAAGVEPHHPDRADALGLTRRRRGRPPRPAERGRGRGRLAGLPASLSDAPAAAPSDRTPSGPTRGPPRPSPRSAVTGDRPTGPAHRWLGRRRGAGRLHAGADVRGAGVGGGARSPTRCWWSSPGRLPWRRVPVLTAAGIAALGVVVAVRRAERPARRGCSATRRRWRSSASPAWPPARPTW